MALPLFDLLSGVLAFTFPRQKECGAPERNSFDIVVCSEMLEHVEGGLAGVEAVIATAARAALAPGGLFVLTTLNRTPENYVVSVVAAEHLFGFIPKVRRRRPVPRRPKSAIQSCKL